MICKKIQGKLDYKKNLLPYFFIILQFWDLSTKKIKKKSLMRQKSPKNATFSSFLKRNRDENSAKPRPNFIQNSGVVSVRFPIRRKPIFAE